jgi:4'-phosphopantetheinyl transferase
MLAVPPSARALPPRQRVQFLSRHARKALDISARKSNLDLGELVQDGTGRPLPVNGVHWSLTHKTDYVGAVASPDIIGIDLEKIIPRNTRALFRKTADSDEWNLTGNKSWGVFHRYWTAKEAVLKATGIGIRDLSTCRVTQILDHHNLIIHYADRIWPIEHHYFSGHIASIVKNADRIIWTCIEAPAD